MRRLVLAGGMVMAALIAYPHLRSGPVRGSYVDRAMRAMAAQAEALESYSADHHAYPPMVPLRSLASRPELIDQAGGGALMTMRPGIAPDEWDRYSMDKVPYACHTDRRGFILISAGPDNDYDIRRPDQVYSPAITQPSPTLELLRYDPTNGSISSGDLFHVKERP